MVLVIAFMTILYRFSGFISGVNLLLYMLLVMGVFWLIGGVLTLPGIAALVLGIGMAVDSAVVTSERIKEELASGKTLNAAFESGNKESWSSIFDANATTLIVAIVLFMFGESQVKGFATMLMITIFATMFIMVFINRKVLKGFVKSEYFADKKRAFINYNENKKDKKFKIDSIKILKKCFIITGIYLVFGIVFLSIKGLNLGIDFRSGSDVTISASKIGVNDVKKDFKELKYDVLSISKQKDDEIYVRLNTELKEKDINKVNNYFGDKYNAKTEINVVTNIVKQELIKNAIFSVLIACVAIIIYISFRFKFNFAISSILVLAHDVLFTIILFSVFKIEVNVIFIAAILTIIGYSINNTIVVFDRIRENLANSSGKLTKDSLKGIVSISISETFTRSLYTTITTLIPVICLIVLGTKGILPFNLALIFGLIAGCYSSILLAGQIWYLLESRNIKEVKTKNTEKKVINVSVKEDNNETVSTNNTKKKKNKKKSKNRK